MFRRLTGWTYRCFHKDDPHHTRKLGAMFAAFLSTHLLHPAHKAVDFAMEHVFLAVHDAMSHAHLLSYTIPAAGAVLFVAFIAVRFNGKSEKE